jgi:hypothetical protein
VRINSLQTSLAVVLALHLGVGPGLAVAASPAIGTVVAKGAFRLNNATLTSNATLFEGAAIETGAAASAMELSSGTRVELGSESKARFFGDHLALERGQSRIDKADGFRVEARGLTILPDTGASTGRIALAGNTRVEVAALTGSFRVLNSRGTMVARIPSGKALALELQSATGPARLTGRLVNRNGHYLLKDETTNVTVEVSGPGLLKEVGRRVDVTGSTDPAATPVSDATQVILVARVAQAPPSGTAPAGSGGAGTAPTSTGGGAGGGSGGTSGTGGAAGGAAGGAGGATGAAVSVTMIAVIGGVAAAAVVGGLAATGSFGGGAPTPVSR